MVRHKENPFRTRSVRIQRREDDSGAISSGVAARVALHGASSSTERESGYSRGKKVQANYIRWRKEEVSYIRGGVRTYGLHTGRREKGN